MIQSYNALSAYQAAAKMTTSLGAVVMLYDGMIKEVKKAKTAIEEGRIEDRFHATQKACQILLGLQSHLDFEKGGDISLMLDQFYHTIFRDLQQVNISNSVNDCETIIGALGEVRESWAKLARIKQHGGSAGSKEEKSTEDGESDEPKPSSVTLSI